jgi:hypothetical protein
MIMDREPNWNADQGRRRATERNEGRNNER